MMLPLSGEHRHVAYRVLVEINEEAAVYDEAMIPWEGVLTVLAPDRLLRDDVDAPDNAEVLDQLAIFASPVVGGRAVVERRAMAEDSPGGFIKVRPWPQHPEPCEPSESCRREYLVEFFRMSDEASPYSVEWAPAFAIHFDEMGLTEPDGAEIHVDVEPWDDPLPSPPPLVGPTPTPDAGAPSP